MTCTELRIPQAVWNAVLDSFAQSKPGLERVAYLDGFLVDEDGYQRTSTDSEIHVATTVVVPDADLQPRNYTVSAEAVSVAGRHLRTQRMTRVAQVHSHGHDWVEHSLTDDDCAYSQQPGAISIVVPFHGMTRPDPAACGVHLRTDTGWQRVQADSIVKVIPTVIDHRSSRWTPNLTDPSGGIYYRFLTWAKNVVRRLGPFK
jgi:hypothetical protein